MERVPRPAAFEPPDGEAWPEETGHVPKVGGPIPHHLVLLQRQPLNHALAILHELAVKRFFNGPNSPYMETNDVTSEELFCPFLSRWLKCCSEFESNSSK